MLDHPSEAADLPVPPPFMWTCTECGWFLRRLAWKWGDPEGCFWEQLQTARHVAEAHPDEVPAPHADNCDLCPTYARRSDDPGGLWAQHRARQLFLPPSLARLL